MRMAPAPSGAIDADTRIALQTFQRGHGLAATGALTPETIQELRDAMARRAAERSAAPIIWPFRIP